MVQNADKALINAAIGYFKGRKNWPAKPIDREGTWDQPFALLARKIAEVCPSEPVKYTALASDLVQIVTHFGIGTVADRERGRAAVRAESIRMARNDMAQGKSRNEAASLLYWLWLNHQHEAIEIFNRCGFDYGAALERIEAQDRPVADKVLVARQNRNQFDLAYLIDNAKDRIVLVAQNHWHLISQPEDSATDFWPRIEAAIRRGVTIEIVAMHPAGPPAMRVDVVPDAIELWTIYMKAPAFREHVDLCWRTLTRFAKAFQAMSEKMSLPSKGGKLVLYRAYFVPMTITIVDPLTDDGMAVISPRTANEVSGTRPEFVLRRREHEEPFLYYWSFVENGLANQGWAKA